MDNPWQLCRTIGPLTLHSQEMHKNSFSQYAMDINDYFLFSYVLFMCFCTRYFQVVEI